MPLQRTEVTPTAEAQCGEFSRRFRFDLLGEQTPGIIVQRIQRWFGVHEIRHLQNAYAPSMAWFYHRYMTGAEIQNYVRPSGGQANATELEYWEAWYVPAGRVRPSYAGLGMGGGVQPFDDEFSLTGIAPSTIDVRNTTRGKYILRAEATYHPIPAALVALNAMAIYANYGFVVGAAACAAGLPSTLHQPRGLPPSTTANDHTIIVRWDAATPDSRVAGPWGPLDYGESQVTSHPGAPTVKESYW